MTVSFDHGYPGHFILDGMLVIGTTGFHREISSIVSEISIFQSLDTPYMSGTILLNDGDDVSSGLPFLGQERLMFSVSTPGRMKIDFNNHHAIIYNVKKRVQSSDRAQTVLIEFTTHDNYKNSFTKISKSFKGIISNMVYDILTSSNYLGSKKRINIDPTLHRRKFVIPNLSPYSAIHLLQREAVSDESKGAHYLFFENPEGYHFRTLDSLYANSSSGAVAPKATYVYQHPESAMAGGSSGRNPAGSLETILHWQIHDNTNSFVNVKSGMYSSTLLTHDIFNKNVKKFEYDYNANYNSRNSTNMNKSKHGPLVALTSVKDNKTITQQYKAKTFLHPSGSENLHMVEDRSAANGNNSENWLQETVSRYVERVENFKLKIETYGNTDLMVGDIIEVIIPVNKPLSIPAGGDIRDRILSGRYVVTELHHLIQPSAHIHSMTMTIMKDSMRNRPPDADKEYPVEVSDGSDIGLQDRMLIA